MVKVLLIEEDPLFGDALQDSVNRSGGFSMTAVSSPEEAVRKSENSGPDIVIIDIAGTEQAECLHAVDYLTAHFRGSKIVLLDSQKRALARDFRKALQDRRIMAYTYKNRNLKDFIALLGSVQDNYTTFPGAPIEPESN